METSPFRCERKFRTENLSFQALAQMVRLLPWGFRPLFPDRHIHNIYFDTPALEAFHDNAAGVASRRKVRLRWYGTEDRPAGEAFLESKIRNGEQGAKHVQRITPPLDVSRKGLMEWLKGFPDLPSGIQPVLSNDFHRSYFGLPRGDIRLTLDRDIFYRGLLVPSSRISDPGLVLELKYPPEKEPEVEAILQNLPFPVMKNSKYFRGIERIFGI